MKYRNYIIIAATVIVFIAVIVSAYMAHRASERITEQFRAVDQSLNPSTATTQEDSFKAVFSSNDVKLSSTAKAITELSDSTIIYIEFLKAKLINDPSPEDNIQASERLLVTGADGDVLHKKINYYQVSIDSLIKPYNIYTHPVGLLINPPMDKGKVATWQMVYFGGAPKFSAITMLNNFENEIKENKKMCLDSLARGKK